MNTKPCAIVLSAIFGLLPLGLYSAHATAATAFRFDRMVPPIPQVWDFGSPSGIAVAPDGSVWLADALYKRIQHVHADGSLILQIEMDSAPLSLDLADDGSVWVTQNNNIPGSVLHYSAAGKLITQFNAYPCNNGPVYCTLGDLTIANDGSVWVGDSGNSRLLHYAANGDFIAQVGGQNGDYSTISIATAPDGSLWGVVGTVVQHLRADGTLMAQFDLSKLIQQFDTNQSGFNGGAVLVDIKVASNGSIWVTDNLIILHLNADGSLIGEFQAIDPGTTFYEGSIGHFKLSLGVDGSVWQASANRIQQFNASGTLIEQFDHLGGAGNGQFGGNSDPKGAGSLGCGGLDISIAKDSSVWVADPCNTLIQHFGADGSFIKQYATPASGMNIAPDGSIWILGGLGISHYTADFGLITSSGINADTFAIAADGTAWMIQTTSVSSQSNPFQNSLYRTLTHVKADGGVISTYKFNVTGDITQVNPTGSIYFTKLAVAADGTLWASGTDGYGGNDNFWHINNTDGSVIAKVKGAGGFALLADGSIWLADTNNNRIQHFAADGSVLSQFGSGGIAPGQFRSPNGIAVGTDGSVWVGCRN